MGAPARAGEFSGMRHLLLLIALLALNVPAVAQGDVAALDLVSTPPGAVVALNHQLLGHTPLRVSQLPAGEHELRLSAGEDYKPYIVRVRIQPGVLQRLEVQLEPSAALLLRQGVSAAREGKDEEAIPLLERAAGDSPAAPEAWWWLGRVHMRHGRDAQALAAFRRFVAFHPHRPEPFLNLGLLHERAGRKREAVTAFKMALLRTKRLRGALAGSPAATWDNIVAAGAPASPEGRLRLAWLYEQKGRWEDALGWLWAAMAEVFPDWQGRDDPPGG